MHIAFEGPIAAGKTTFARLLAEQLGTACDLLLEDFEGNEFLRDFYETPARWALPMQLDFLLSRHAQFRTAHVSSKSWLVADHSMLKDEIFARLLLRDRESDLYQRIARSLPSEIARPDLTVYLDAPVETLLDRIRARGRSYESHVDANYLERLRHGYNTLFETVESSRTVIVDTSTFDGTSSEGVSDCLQAILERAQVIRNANGQE